MSSSRAQHPGTLRRAGCPLDVDLPIDVATVADPDDIDHTLTIIHAEHHSIITDTESPQILFTPKLACAARPRLDREPLDSADDAGRDRSFKRFQFPACRACKCDRVFSHRRGACPGGVVCA